MTSKPITAIRNAVPRNSGTRKMRILALRVSIRASTTPPIASLITSTGKAGNKATTQFANRRGSYVLMDRATVLTMKKDISLEVLVEGDPFLYNYIAVIRVNPETFQGLNVEGALAFTDWLCSDEAQSLVRDFGVEKYGEPLFFPNSDQWKAKNP